MSHQLSRFCSIELPEELPPWRDNNANYGLGSYTINYDNRVIQQTRSTYRRHVRGTEEEEAEYAEYGEYRHGDIQLLKMIDCERVFDRRTGRFIECKRCIFVGKVMSGEGIGTIVTVEAYEGSDAPEAWKQRFLCLATGQSLFRRVDNAHLLALNRSKIPLLIFSGGLIPLEQFGESLGTKFFPTSQVPQGVISYGSEHRLDWQDQRVAPKGIFTGNGRVQHAAREGKSTIDD
ncbi:hypothetical protein PM082_009257 [Marasmius tenuissimus]|nr:hypothetical protein PM082_009257 [Marasmius tenuissimus]